MSRLNEIQSNAQRGLGPCEGCPAHEASGGRLVNPGLGNPNGMVMFMTDEPRHLTEWDEYDSWEEYNDEWMSRFAGAKGGRFITRLLSKTDLSLDDVWVADSIKCPTKRDAGREIPAANTKETFEHCRDYLRPEIESVDPDAIVTLGKEATIRTLRALGVSRTEAQRVRVTKGYGRAKFDTEYPVVISLHWAQRTVSESEWVPVVQESISELR